MKEKIGKTRNQLHELFVKEKTVFMGGEKGSGGLIDLLALENEIREEKQKNNRFITNIESAFRKEFTINKKNEDETLKVNTMNSLFEGIIGNHSIALSLFQKKVSKLI